MEINDEHFLVIILCSFGTGMLVRFLSFLMKSRCTSLKCCGSECNRDVISQENLANSVLRDVEMPNLGNRV